ncbi:MAG TPA: LssY C-terminal domain-containing protein [Candidatus Saccharimonadales bacterium]|nr:LssY C-terminal domain-containing protein [Candidatus Saccharimonadales bacterium]
MLSSVLRVLVRFIVLLPGIAIAYFSVQNIFPYFDSRLPLGLAILATYMLGAYVLIPALIRLVRFIHPPKHLPLYCVTPDGFASDPLNVGLICSRRQLISTMEAAGWHRADPHRLPYVIRFIVLGFLGRPYPNAPVSYLYLFGRKQDVAFVRSVEDSLVHRHHVRFWAAPPGRDWSFGPPPNSTDTLWVGAASLDIGAAIIRHNFQVTHMIHPDTDAERELIVEQIDKTGLAKSVKRVKLSSPYRLVNRVWRGYLHSDGKMAVIRIKA